MDVAQRKNGALATAFLAAFSVGAVIGYYQWKDDQRNEKIETEKRRDRQRRSSFEDVNNTIRRKLSEDLACEGPAQSTSSQAE
mmetsp:Transcript_11028/g.33532  ORF Transcript_11028/g.33532 Transcript_11028/m.33532 type:complete len:83 (+) Transcript_11028:49-297(+)